MMVSRIVAEENSSQVPVSMIGEIWRNIRKVRKLAGLHTQCWPRRLHRVTVEGIIFAVGPHHHCSMVSVECLVFFLLLCARILTVDAREESLKALLTIMMMGDHVFPCHGIEEIDSHTHITTEEQMQLLFEEA
jgi:hypothetical protein